MKGPSRIAPHVVIRGILAAAFDMDVAYGAAGPMVQAALMAEEMEPMMMMASCQAEERCAQVEHIREAIGENIDPMMPMVASAPPSA